MAATDEPRDETAPAEREPNFVRYPQEVLETLIGLRLPCVHKDIVHYVVRQTFGYHRDEHPMKAADLVAAIGASDRAVRRALNELEALGVIAKVGGGQGRVARLRVLPTESWSVPNRIEPPENLGSTDPGLQTLGPLDPRVHRPEHVGSTDPETSGLQARAPLKKRQKDTVKTEELSSIEERADIGSTDPRTHRPEVDLFGNQTDLEQRVQRWANVLGGDDREAKVAWLLEHLELIEAEARAEFPKVTPTAEALNAKIKALIIRYRRQHDSGGADRPTRRGHARADATTGWKHGL